MTGLLPRLAEALADRYRLEREIGQGGMATVYLAQDVKHERRVAVKVLRPELAAVVGADRFLQEIRVTAHLQHPHILALFDSGRADSFLFYVMPYLEGESLRDRLKREKQLPVDDAIRIARQVALALAYAHQHHVIHRDIKPENILLSGGEPVVADFGIARAVTAAGGERLTETGLSLGTPQYMSPEQATADRELDGRTDIYSLGCVLYEMLAGEPPFTGPTTQSIIAKMLTEEPRQIRALRASVAPHIEAAVLKAVAKLPADRFSSAAEFAEALVRPTGAVTSAEATVASSVTALPGRARLAPHPALLVAAALALAGSGAVVARWIWRPATPRAAVAQFVVVPNPGVRIGEALGTDVTIAPDGSRLAFVGQGGQGEQLYVRSLDELQARPVVGSEGATGPVFSPDGEWLAFKATDGTIQKVALAGGGAVRIAPSSQNWRGASWRDDGLMVLGSTTSGLYLVPGSGGEPRPLTMLDSTRKESRHYTPEFLPDGKSVLFSILMPAGRRVAVASLATGEVTLTEIEGSDPHYLPTGHLVYGTAEQSMFMVPFDPSRARVTGPPVPVLDSVRVEFDGTADFAVSRNGTMVYVRGTAGRRQLVVQDARGTARPLLAALHDYRSPRFSPDGTRLAFEINEPPGAGIWILALRDGTLSRVAFGGGTNLYPVWTPDGRRITFASDRDGPYQLYWVASDGAGTVQAIFHSREPAVEAAWTPDGQTLIYRSSAPGDLRYRRIQGDTTSQPIVATDAAERMPALSPDGRWLAYASNESGRDEVYVLPFPPDVGGRIQISDDGGSQPVWAPNGRAIFYRSGDRFFRADLAVTPSLFVVGRQFLFSGPYIVGTGLHANYDVHPDGQRFVLVAPSDEPPQLVVVLNWFDALRRQATARR